MLIFKVDFEKAFDSVNWRYLDFMLCNLSFGLIWRSWIKACLESSRTSILVNGSPTSEFNVKRGLRQGDPLSPFLFIIIMEDLHMALSDSVRNGFIRGININSSGINLSHLFFVDDVIITMDWSTHDLENVIRIFKVFYLASGLKINIHKSSIYGVAVSHEEVQLMASNTGCNAGFFPFSYLGLPIGSNMSLTANWKFLVDKFHSKSLSLNANLFSNGGLLTLHQRILRIGSPIASISLLEESKFRRFLVPFATVMSSPMSISSSSALLLKRFGRPLGGGVATLSLFLILTLTGSNGWLSGMVLKLRRNAY
ncbi:putative RNA-directed DNA polymerase, eukaryota, reverse transcriptase zinc-binding domain protein [Tanacetum coccineum]